MDCAVLDSVLCCNDDGQTTAVDTCCCDGKFAAFATQHKVFVCYVSNTGLPLLELRSTFLRPAAALAIQTSQAGSTSLPTEQNRTLLAAATASGLLIWVLEDAYVAVADSRAPPAPLRLVDERSPGTSEAVALSSDDLAAVGCDSDIVIWDLHHLEVIYRLKGHQGVVTALGFNPDSPNQLVSTAEDRTFNVWDLQEGQLLYQSNILGAAVPSCIAVESQRLVLGCINGSLLQFDLSLLPTCRELQVLDASKHMQQVATAAVTAAQAAQCKQVSGPRTITAATGTVVPALRQQLQQLTCTTATGGKQADTAGQCDFYLPATEGSGSILSMQFVQRGCRGGSSSSSGGSLFSRQLVDELLKPASQLLVCTRRGLLLLNLASGEVEICYLFGPEAGHVYDSVHAQMAAPNSTSRGSSANSNKQATVPVSQLQKPSEQQLHQQQRLLSCFRALPEVEQPAAACCFAWQQQHEQFQQAAQLICCIASGFSSRVSLLQLAAGRQRSAWGSGAITDEQQQQQLSVFQTKPLPAGSPLLARTARVSKGYKAAAAVTVAHAHSPKRAPTSNSGTANNSIAGSSSSSSSGRARWSKTTDSSAGTPPAIPPASALVKPGSITKSALASVATKTKNSSKGSSAEQPVTFHRKIKSSGYGFVQPKIKLGQAKPAPIKVGLQGNKGPQLLAHQLSVQRQYPLDSGPPVDPMPDQTLPGDIPTHGGGIVRVEFAGDGCRLLTGSTDRTARCLWLPLSKHGGAGTTFVGHNGPVNSICWSHAGEYLLTASADRTARLWSASLPSPLITFKTADPAGSSSSSTASSTTVSTTRGLQRSSSSTSSSRRSSTAGGIAKSSSSRGASGNGGVSSSSSSSTAGSQGFLGEVTAARFFYMDELVVLATGNKLLMYRYTLADAPADDDIQRLKSTGSYSLAATYSSNCQAVLDVAAANSFLSTLLLLACSNRSIELVDAATMQVSCTFPDAHARPVQRLVQPAASPFVSHARQIHELFASAAPDGVIKLWDVRSGSCVRSFTGHKHSSSQVPVGAAFSPCMRYLATGSEDKATCIYDLRSTTLLHKLRPPGQADVVADVAFHPYKPQLVVGCMNGRLHWYGDVCRRAQQHSLPGGGMVERQLVDEFG